MRQKTVFATAAILWLVFAAVALAYPPAVGILSKSKNCLSCHVNNGKWQEGPQLVIDIVDKATGKSLLQPDGSFLLSVKRGQTATVSTVTGYQSADTTLHPARNAWLYIDTSRIASSSLSKFPFGWEVNLPMACRLPGDKYDPRPDARLTVLPMTVRASDNAATAVMMLQVMLTKGEAVKGNPKEGMLGNYFERTVRLEVID
jgi:hypothetical protein